MYVCMYVWVVVVSPDFGFVAVSINSNPPQTRIAKPIQGLLVGSGSGFLYPVTNCHCTYLGYMITDYN